MPSGELGVVSTVFARRPACLRPLGDDQVAALSLAPEPPPPAAPRFALALGLDAEVGFKRFAPSLAADLASIDSKGALDAAASAPWT